MCLKSDLKRFPVQFWSVNDNLVQNGGQFGSVEQVIEQFHTYKIGCAFCGAIVRAFFYIALF